MKAKEYYNSTRMVETRNWTLGMAMDFAEEYYEARTKALTIPDVSKSFYCQQGLGIMGFGNEAVSLHRVHNKLVEKK